MENTVPITKSAKKSLKVSKTKQSQNKKQEIVLSKALKKLDKNNVNSVISAIDKSAKIGIIHKNKAARLKSQVMKKMGGTPKTAIKVEKKVEKKVTEKTVSAKVSKAKKPIKK